MESRPDRFASGSGLITIDAGVRRAGPSRAPVRWAQEFQLLHPWETRGASLQQWRLGKPPGQGCKATGFQTGPHIKNRLGQAAAFSEF